MIDPLRPYWPTNRSIAGLLVRGFFLLVAVTAVMFSRSRSFGLLIVVGAALGQATVLVFEWMELKHARRAGLVAAAIITVFLFFALVLALVIEGRSVLVLSVR